MGAYILCQTKTAEHPLHVEVLGISVYSIEELCYVIYQNLPVLDEAVLNASLANWLRDELALTSLAKKITAALDVPFSVRNFVLPVLREIHYLNSQEMKSFERKIQEMENQSKSMRLKQRGDLLFGRGIYSKAIKSYELSLKEVDSAAGNMFIGAIYNNMGCAYARLFFMSESCDCFEKAYELLHTKNTLKSYLTAMYLKSGPEEYKQLGRQLEADEGTMEETLREIKSIKVPQIPEDLDQALLSWTRTYHKM